MEFPKVLEKSVRCVAFAFALDISDKRQDIISRFNLPDQCFSQISTMSRRHTFLQIKYRMRIPV